MKFRHEIYLKAFGIFLVLLGIAFVISGPGFIEIIWPSAFLPKIIIPLIGAGIAILGLWIVSKIDKKEIQ